MNTYTIIDKEGGHHTLDLTYTKPSIDTHQVTTVTALEERVIFELGGNKISCTHEALWHAVAGQGAVPTATEAGRLLAEALSVRSLVQMLSSLLADRTPLVWLPAPRLDPFIESALARCEQSPTMVKVEALSSVVGQPVHQVIAWLAERGKAPLADDTPPALGAPVEQIPYSSLRSKKRAMMFLWTAEMIEQLTKEFLADTSTRTIGVLAQEIADRHGWQFSRVQYQIYYLKLPKRRKTIAAQVVEEAVVHNVAVPEVQPGPVELLRGNFVWDVKIDGHVRRWNLDYPYGRFPAASGEVVYKGQCYKLKLVGTNTLTAFLSSATNGHKEEVAV